MKRMRTIALIALLGATLLSCVTPAIPVETPDVGRLADGRYEGYYDGGMVKVRVAVTVAAGKIVTIEILEHDCGMGKPAEAIVNTVIAAQSLDVDAVSGATHSSRVILKAIELALTGAGQ